MNVAAHELRSRLVELAERTYGQLIDLFKDTTVERCELMVRDLHHVSVHCRQLADQIQRGESPTV